MKTSKLPFWVRYTNDCPLYKKTGTKATEISAPEYFLLVNLLCTEKEINHAIFQSQVESQARAKFKSDFKRAPESVKRATPDNAYQSLELRLEFYARLREYNIEMINPVGFGKDNSLHSINSSRCRLPRR